MPDTNLPAQPVHRGFDYTGFYTRSPNQPPPGDRLDSDLDRLYTTANQLIRAVHSLGTPPTISADRLAPDVLPALKAQILPDLQAQKAQILEILAQAVEQATTATVAAGRAAQLAEAMASSAERVINTVIATPLPPPYPDRASADAEENGNRDASNSANDAALSASQADRAARLSGAWAEYIDGPNPIPPTVFAGTAITGEHWSSRYWAHKAAGAFGSLSELYLGALPQPPTSTSTGDPIPIGAIYYNTTSQQPFVWDGDSWEPFYSPVKAVTQTLTYSAAAAQTVFPLTVPDLAGNTYTINALAPEPLQVFVNGVRLPVNIPAGVGDWTLNPATSTVTFTSPLAAQSLVQVDTLAVAAGESITDGTINNTPIGAITPSTGRFTTLSASGAVSGAGFVALLAPYAPLASPIFTGDPRAPTPLTADNDTSVATTAFVKAQNYATLANPSFTGAVTLASANAGIELGAPATANTPYIDLHSSGLSTDYDVRLMASGGTATAGTGNLNIYAASLGAPAITAVSLATTGQIHANAAIGSDTSITAGTSLQSLQGIIQSVSGGGQAGISCWNTALGYAAGFWVDNVSGRLNVGGFNGAGTATSYWGGFNATGLALQGTLTAIGQITSANGVTSNNGRLFSVGSGLAAVACYNTTRGYAAGMWTDAATAVLCLGATDSSGGPLASYVTIGAGGLQVNSAISAGAVITGSTIVSTSGVFQIAPNYYMQRGSDGAWRWVEGGTVNLTLDTSGHLYTRGNLNTNDVYAAGAVRFGVAATDQFFGHASGSLRYFQYQNDGWRQMWDASTGVLSYYDGTGHVLTQVDSVGNFYCRGTVSSASPSDARIKTNVLDYTRGLADLTRLRPVSYQYNGQGGTTQDGITRYGLIAQEAQPYIPECIYPTPIGPTDPLNLSPDPDWRLPDQLSLDDKPLIFALLNAVRELAMRVETLEGAPGTPAS